MAKQYHIEYGGEMRVERLQELLSTNFPEHALFSRESTLTRKSPPTALEKAEEMEKWLQIVLHSFRKVCHSLSC